MQPSPIDIDMESFYSFYNENGGWLKEALLLLLGTGLVAFVGLCTGLYLFQDRLIFFPQPITKQVLQAVQKLPGTTEMEVVTKDGYRLHGWLRRHSGRAEKYPVGKTSPQGLVIYFGGNAEEVSNQIYDAQSLHPWWVSAFNYRGYGLSEGHPSERALVSDALAIYDQLTQQVNIHPNRIVVFGRSLGSGVAVQLAANRPVGAVVLISPFDSLRSLAQKQYPFVPVSLLLKHPFDSLARVPKIQTHLLVIAGKRDSIIPSTLSQNLYTAWSGPKQWLLLPKAHHNDIHTHPSYWPSIRQFLTSY